MSVGVEVCTRQDVASRTKRSVRETYEMQKRGEIPPPDLYFGRSPRWFGDRLDEYLRSRAEGRR